MKIIAFVDLHGRMNSLKKIVERANKEDIELVINAGDLSVFGNDLDKIAKKLSKIKKPVIMIPYNHESDLQIMKLCKKIQESCLSSEKMDEKRWAFVYGIWRRRFWIH